MVLDLRKVAVLGEPIVGQEVVTLDEHGPGAIKARGLPSPKEPTQAARDLHYLTHLPYCSWCPICVASRRPNHHHRLLRDATRTIPRPVGDYGFIGNSGDDSLVCVLILKVYPYGILLACIVPKKGAEDSVVNLVSNLILDMGLTPFAYWLDREPNIMALFDAACRES